MSTTNNMSRHDLHWQLLVTVSAAALLASVYGAGEAEAAGNDSDRPQLWIELGGQLEQMTNGQEPFAPAFVANIPDTLFSPLNVEKPLRYSFGGEGGISFEPRGSDWALSASIRIGRTNGVMHKTQLIKNAYVPVHVTQPKYHGGYSLYPYHHAKFEDVRSKQSETHAVLDFQASRDVGLGLFGNNGSSSLGFGVRFAQFTSKMNVNIKAAPDVHYLSTPINTTAARQFWRYSQVVHFHGYVAQLNIERSFRGVGPSLAWKGSAALLGNPDVSEITFDWGASAAVLFGRQKVQGHHQTTARRYSGHNWTEAASVQGHGLKPGNFNAHITNQTYDATDPNRAHSVIVPNVGAMAGLSFRYADAKISFGYRADFFFGAMDGGIDTRKTENRGFFGPFASISFGLGD
ncbi:MAG TPA: hypothetical protein VGT78_00305 [Rhizomicrobium sp.]|nr:hypothetical protein [Rhizomicrobium sp.]